MTSIFRRKGRKGWTLKYRDGQGVDRMRSFKTRRLAEDEALRLHVHPDTGRRQTFKEYAAGWLVAVAPHIRHGTLPSYQWGVDKALPVLGDLLLRDVERRHVRELGDQLLASGLKRNTVLNALRVVSVCLQSAVDDGILYVNPATRHGRGKLKRAAHPAPDVKALDEHQAPRFLQTARATEPGHYLLFRFMLATGVRPGEVLALKWEDLDLIGRKALVRRGVTRNKEGPTKTGKHRTVDLAKGLTAELQAWDVESKAIALRRGAERATWVFPSRFGRPKEQRTLEHACKRILSAAGLPAYHTPHHLRHTYASLQLARGVSPRYVQLQLGHASLRETTETYGRWIPMVDMAAADALESVVTDSVTTPSEIGSSGSKKHA